MINSLEVVIQYLKIAGLSTDQIASKDRFGDTSGWLIGSKAVIINLDGGTPDLYLPVQTLRLEIRCYSEDRYQALELLNEIITLSRSTSREAVAVTGGTGLLYYLHQASGPSALYDDDLAMDFALMFFEAKISEIGVN